MRKLQMQELNRLSVEEFKDSEKMSFCIILDDIRSMNNIGSVFRTADAFRAEKIYLCGITANPPHRDIEKTALGATESVTWEYCEDILPLIEKLKAEEYTVYAVEQVEESLQLSDFKAISSKKCAFIFGNEVFGVSEDAVKKADACLEIPQYGTKHSLNISVSVGIVCWEYIRQITS